MVAFAHDGFEVDPHGDIARSTANSLVKRGLLEQDSDYRDRFDMKSPRKVAKALGFAIPRTKDPVVAWARCLKTVFALDEQPEVYSGAEIGERKDEDEDYRTMDYSDAVAVARMYTGRDEDFREECAATLMLLAGFAGYAESDDVYFAYWREDAA